MRKKLKIGLIGAGWIVDEHIKAYLELSDKVEIYAIADINKNNLQKVLKNTHIKRVYANYSDLLKLKEIDAVDIMLPTFLHAEAVIAACKSGKHVLCEKPFALNIEQCDKMIAAAQNAQVLLMPMHNCIFYPPLLKAYDVLTNGDIGLPLIYRSSHVFGYPGGNINFLSTNYRGEKSKGGGAILEGGVHSIYIAERFMGRISKVTGILSQFPEKKINIENGGIIALEFKNGGMGVLSIYWGAGYGDDSKEIIGTNGAIILKGIEWQALAQPSLSIYRDPKGLGHHTRDESQKWEIPYVSSDWSQSFLNTINHFVECIVKNKKMIITAEDGKSSIRTVNAIYKAASEKKNIEI